MPTTVRKLLKYPSTYFDKQTYAIVNFTFSTPELTPGNHLIQMRATNQWGISGYANQTVTIPEMTHDIAITGITPYRTIVPNRTMTSINVTIANQGDFQETFTIIASYNSTAFASQMITVGNGSSVKWLVIWNTTGVTLGNYIITTIAGQLPGETDTADNSFSSLMQVSILGDINGDGRVDMKDVSKVAAGFQATPGQPRWTVNGDLDENGVINMKDISTIAKEFGKIV